MRGFRFVLLLGVAIGAGLGFASGYRLWGEPHQWYAPDMGHLPAGAEGDLIHYGWQLVTDTARYIGKDATDPSLRFAGNNLACVNCHLKAGLQPFGAPFVSTFASYPLMVSDNVVSLKHRIDGCMTRSLNGKPLPHDGRELDALIAYIKYVGTGTPEGVRVAGMGLKPLPSPALSADATRGAQVYSAQCASCHQADGQGEKRNSGIGYSIPPLWGDGAFNAASGLAKLEMAASYIHDNMPYGVDYLAPVLSAQDAWDVAAYVESQPRPPAPLADIEQ